ncbi:hypothetical protein BJY04DRAFT_215616 [Aspergillus karnatakaensis]|uniref:uncharacterized protein n=1 Tax=Aspergillus karnatakaensis TaxID=1810916 RepID=UPI003CCE2D91
MNQKYHLSVTLSGPGVSERAHWGLIIHAPGQDFGDLLHVRVIDIPSNTFQFENRTGHGLADQDAWGLAKVVELDYEQRMRVIAIAGKERPPTPRGGQDCQDWVINALAGCEIEEIVPDGTVDVWIRRLGMPTERIKEEVRADGEGLWVSLNGH